MPAQPRNRNSEAEAFRVATFLKENPVFTHAEFVKAHTATGRSENTSNSLLAQRLARGTLVRIRRGLYATPTVSTASSKQGVDPYLIANKLTHDSVIAYHSALAFHGKAYSAWTRFQYLTSLRVKGFHFDGCEYVGVRAPRIVRNEVDFGGQVSSRPHAGGFVRVTSLERCLVDLLHSPAQGGGWEEIWRSLEMVEFFDLDAVLKYAKTLASPLTVARLGFFLEQHRESWMVEDRHLTALEGGIPAQRRYWSSSRETGRLISRWNIIVPTAILERRWQDVS
jgi:predicted transcriptional regulator of viral defense system